MKQARNIIVKSCFTPDEFIDFNGDCAAVGKSQSAMLRDAWRAMRNGTARIVPLGRPPIGQRMAMFPPRRAARPELRMRN
jgi:hypothetical protein